MDRIDQSDPRPASVQIAADIRSQVLSGQVEPGNRLLSQPDLADHYGVARETIKRALDILRGEGLIVARQGSGTFVLEAAELAEYSRAFAAGYQLAIDDLQRGYRQLTSPAG